MTDRRRYLFVVGCPRSGTTVLWRLLVSHRRVALGLERYHGRQKLDRSLFERERFFTVEPGDTFYDDLESFEPTYAKMRDRYDQAVYVGDKIPMLYRSLPELSREFGSELWVIAIVRDPYAVAASVQRRHDDPSDTTWPDADDHRAAVTYWNQSLAAILEFMDTSAGNRLLPVSYEQLFVSGEGPQALFDFLDLPVTSGVWDAYARALRRSADLMRQRGFALTVAQRNYVAANARTNLYDEVMATIGRRDAIAQPDR